MKKLLVGAIALLSLCVYAPAQNIENQVIVSQFAQWSLAGTQALVSGSNTLVPFNSCTRFAGGRTFTVLSAPVKIVDDTTGAFEVVTPTSVVVSAAKCTATLAPANAHSLPYHLVSGTGGLQEAVNATKLSGTFNTAILDKNFYSAGGSSAVISAAIGSANLPLVDVTFAPYVTYRWNGTNYVVNSANTGGSAPTAAAGAAAGTSPTGPTNTGNGNSFSVALTTGTATTTGTLFTETWPNAASFSVVPNVTVTSVGSTAPPAFTFTVTGSSTHVLTVTLATAPPTATAYVFQVSAQ